MRIAVPAETFANETRVAATPETVKKYIAAGFQVVVQKGAGEASSIPDEQFIEAGATVADSFADVCKGAALVLKVRSPSKDETAQLEKNTVVAGLFSPFTNPLLKSYNDAGLACFSMELIPRISRAQSMDVLSSQANVAGYKAVLLALEHYRSFMPMLMTAAGTVQPAKVLVMGAGVAGLQAIATARRLGAMVEAFDVRPAAKEQVESLGARFVEVPSEEDAEDRGGYAKEMSDAYKQQQAELIHQHAAVADIIITTALIPGRPAPVLITEETVDAMKPGSVIVDMAVESGGNCPLSEMDSVWQRDGVTLIGISNIPALMSTDASNLYARNLFNFTNLMLDGESGSLHIDMDDEIIEASLLCRDGEVMKPQFFAAAGGEA
ncbi:MAG: Re/Si-specific NAD(P)(+) transhydrogenase subunit alpha [Mariprofundaceae bacterium]|nr:Re/Si-specific NAD(P)(+) transhydrogenase subunit alpha [Mariprofundaceae bacterium]